MPSVDYNMATRSLAAEPEEKTKSQEAHNKAEDNTSSNKSSKEENPVILKFDNDDSNLSNKICNEKTQGNV